MKTKVKVKIKVKYFASMREATGLSEELVETVAKTPEKLYFELSKKYHFDLSKEQLKVAINEEYCSFLDEFKELDTIVFIPPVAGG